jgi:hypothetical protein
MEIWMWILIVVVALLAIFAVGKRSMEHQNRPMSQEEIERERGGL